MTRGPGSPWDVCDGFVKATIGNGKDVVAVLHPAHFLVNRLRKVVPQARLFLHFPEVITIPGSSRSCIVASDRDRDFVASRAVWPDLSQSGPALLRRLDTLYATSHDIGLIIIGAAEPCAVLSGAADILVRHAPIVMLDVATVPPSERDSAVTGCGTLLVGYQFRDSLLLPCSELETRSELLQVLAETTFCAFPGPRQTAGTAVDDSLLLDEHLASVARQAWKVPTSTAKWPHVLYRMDDQLPCSGFHKPETDGTDSWRWSGPAPRATFYVPVPGPGAWAIKLLVFAWGRAGAPGDVEVFVERRRAAIIHQDDYEITLAPVTVPGGSYVGFLQVDVAVAHMVRASSQDRRLVGICLSGISVEHAI